MSCYGYGKHYSSITDVGQMTVVGPQKHSKDDLRSKQRSSAGQARSSVLGKEEVCTSLPPMPSPSVLDAGALRTYARQNGLTMKQDRNHHGSVAISHRGHGTSKVAILQWD